MPAKPKFDARKLMEKAAEVMRQSIPERRRDGKKSPAVGAVLCKPDGTIETAYRGELRDGDHAEFALLERKNRANRLDGAVLFTTLEPCAPGARSFPKLSCAERIVLARIKEVWVGLEDPDPTVDRKGIKYLQDNGVTVHMFDRDLQETIQAEIGEFIDQALERAVEVEKPKVLSKYETSVPATDMRDFSREALDRYRAIAKIENAVDSEAFQRRLLQQGLLKEEKGRLVPSGFGLLLFGKSPRDVMPQAGLLGTIHYPDGTEETKDFDGPMVLVPGQAIQWLRDKIPNPIDRSDARRKEANEKFFGLVREGSVNGLVHRNYDIREAKCQLIVTPDTVVVKSPGRPVEPITLEQMQLFSAPMLSRNPVLHYVFARMELAEERGLGLKSLKNGASQAGLPLPSYRWEDPYLVLTLYRTAESAMQGLGAEVLESLSKAEREGWRWLATKEATTSTAYAQAMKLPYRTAMNHLQRFQKIGLLEKVGSGPATEYRVRRQ